METRALPVAGFPWRARPLRSTIISMRLDNREQVKSSPGTAYSLERGRLSNRSAAAEKPVDSYLRGSVVISVQGKDLEKENQVKRPGPA